MAVSLRLAVGSGWSADPGDAGLVSVTNRVIAALVFEGLTRLEPSGEVVPALAERWIVSDDRRQWTFVLPDELADNHGEPLTAHDVKASLERLAARGPADPVVVQLQAVSGWTRFVSGASGEASGLVARDDRTLVIQLDEPFEPLAAVLAEPAFGITGPADDGTLRTTGSYTFGLADELVAVSPTAAVDRIELVAAEQSSERLLADGLVDWGVLDADDKGTTVPGAVVRQPLDLRTGLVVRLADIEQRQALLAVLDAAALAAELDRATSTLAVVPEPRPGSLPRALTVHVPEGSLAGLGSELETQLLDAGVEPTVVLVTPAEFAAAVAGGEAVVFPMVMAGSGFGRSAGVTGALPGGVDDVFGAVDPDRELLVAEILATADGRQRSVLIDALDEALVADHLWLPLGSSEVRVGLSEQMNALRVLPDGTLDLSGFAAG